MRAASRPVTLALFLASSLALLPASAEEKAKDEGDTTLVTSVTEGLRVKTKDGSIDVHVGGRFQEHFRTIFDRPDSRTVPDSFFVRAARVQIDGTFFKDYGFMVQGDFPSSSTGPSPTLQAGYVEWKRFEGFRLTFGQFKAPASQDRLISRLYSDFVEDDVLTRFVPGYETGVMASGKLAGGRLGYQVAVTNGRSHLDNQGRSRADDNDGKEIVARLTLQPWAKSDGSAVQSLRFGVYGSSTSVDEVAISGSSVNAFDISTPELAVLMLDPDAGFLDGRRTRAGGELSWAVGPVGIKAEYLLREDEMSDGEGLAAEVPTKAWYGSVTWLVTGEKKKPEARVVPDRPLLKDGGAGAIELALRLSGGEIGSEIGDIVTLEGQAREVQAVTFGVNWWLARNLRLSVNGVKEDYGTPIDFGEGRTDDSLTGALVRFQIDF